MRRRGYFHCLHALRALVVRALFRACWRVFVCFCLYGVVNMVYCEHALFCYAVGVLFAVHVVMWTCLCLSCCGGRVVICLCGSFSSLLSVDTH